MIQTHLYRRFMDLIMKMFKVLKISLRVFSVINKSYRLCGVSDLLVGGGFLLYPEILLYTHYYTATLPVLRVVRCER